MNIPTIQRLILGLLFAASSTSPLLAASRYEIALLGQSIDPPAGVDRAMLEEVLSRAAGEKVHFLVQLHAIPDAAGRGELARRGIELGDYVAGNAWMAAVPAAAIRSLAEVPEVRWAMPWSAERKLHPRVARGEFGEWTRERGRPEWVMLFVQLHHDAPLERISGVAASAGGVALPPVAGLHGATVWIPEGRIAALAAHEEVLWIEEGPPPLEAANDLVRESLRTGYVQGGGWGLDGSGVKLLVFDEGTVRASHQTFDAGAGSRVSVIDAMPISGHATHVAGTAAGDGSGSAGTSRGRGIATGATLLSAGYQQIPGTMLFYDNAGDLEADYALARNVYQADFATNSLGSNVANNLYYCATEGDYGLGARLIDEIVRGTGPAVDGSMIVTWAAGNERTGGTVKKGRCGANYATTAPPACAKNPIHVGAVNSDGLSMTNSSSWGPCDDGRLKPTVVAPGCEQGRVNGETFVYSALAGSDSEYGGLCGTSMAAPAVAGAIALLIEDWRAALGVPGGWPLPALVKALLIHTAKDLGQPGPDYIYGYGAVDAKAMIDTLRAGVAKNGARWWDSGQVAHGAVDNYRYQVDPGTAELKASLAWDDPAAAAYAAFAPVNDLTLQLIGPGGIVHDAFVLSPGSPQSEATTGLNPRDNQEQAIVKNPAPGRWVIRVTGSNVPVGPQRFGLVSSVAAAKHDPSTCVTTSAGFENGDDGFVLSGASRLPAPGTGHGAFSLQLGGAPSTVHDAYREFTVPGNATRAVLTYHAYSSTQESLGIDGHAWDFLTAEIRDAAGNVQAVVDNRNDGWKTGVWTRQFEIDLLPWVDKTIRIAFRATNNASYPTTFSIDDLTIETCSP